MEKSNKGIVLITGALGFIASSLAEKLLSLGYTVVGIDNFLSGSAGNISSFKNNERFHFIRGDVNKFETMYQIFYTFNPDYIFHYSACVGVQRTLQNPLWVLNDIKGFENICRLSRDFNVKRLFFSSSSEVYGEPVEFPQRENTTPLNSKLPYAVVKNIGEVYLKTYQKEYDLDYTIFRFFNTYGPRQADSFVISKFIFLALENKPLSIYGDGSQTRTFCYIDDNVDATINAMENNHSINRVYNIGSDLEIPVLELGKLIIELTGSDSKIEHLPPLEEGDMTRRKPDIGSMKSELLNNRDLLPLNEGIRMTIDYFKNNGN